VAGFESPIVLALQLSDDAGPWGGMRTVSLIALAVVSSFLLVGCATIVKGTTQTVAIDTPGVPGAVCTISSQNGPKMVSTPGTVVLDKGSTALPIQCTKQCYLTGSSVIPSGTEAMTAGNVILGGVIGLGVDAATGAMNKYPDMVTVAMMPDQACRQAPPSRPRASQ
jgi:hypothetical protein